MTGSPVLSFLSPENCKVMQHRERTGGRHDNLNLWSAGARMPSSEHAAPTQPEEPRSPFLGAGSSLNLTFLCSGDPRDGLLLLSNLTPSACTQCCPPSVYLVETRVGLASQAQPRSFLPLSRPPPRPPLGPLVHSGTGTALLPKYTLALGRGLSPVPPLPMFPQGGRDRLAE